MPQDHSQMCTQLVIGTCRVNCRVDTRIPGGRIGAEATAPGQHRIVTHSPIHNECDLHLIMNLWYLIHQSCLTSPTLDTTIIWLHKCLYKTQVLGYSQ